MDVGSKVLVTGASGYLGAALVRRLRADGIDASGIDLVPSPTTDLVASSADRDRAEAILRDRGITAIVHAGALHKPHIATHSQRAFVEANVEGTLALLEAATAPGSPRRSLRVHVDDLADDRSRDPRRAGRRRTARGVARRGSRASAPPQHLRRDQARSRAPVPGSTTNAPACPS